jgi:exopolysaccharide production protein ExoQ
MPRALASLLTFAFIIFLFRRDFRQQPKVTRALWIPLLWMFISASRATSEWLGFFGVSIGGTSLEEGSPIDRLVYLGLICAAFYVLNKRHVRLAEVIRNNRWLAVFLLYCFLAVIWSDFPFVALKRWIKVIGHPLMVLVILTEPDPDEALTTVMKRCAYLIVPISVLFIKYYPEYGRVFSSWTGVGANTGITTNKNLLGCDLLILGFFFVWHLLQIWGMPKNKARRDELIFCAGFLGMIWWLLIQADSKTSLTALVVGILIVLFTGLRRVNKRLIGAYIVWGVLILVAAEATFGIYAKTLQLLRRNPTLTDRTELWQDLLKADINPVLGAGFESFWLGERMERIWEKYKFRPNQAHNGYLETYLNLGLIGLFLLVTLLIATYAKARRELLRNFQFGRFRLGFLAAAIVYNWTEAGFKATHFLFFAFYIVAIDYSRRVTNSAELTEESTADVEQREPIFAHQRLGTIDSVMIGT